jgi:hypothetical protein
MVTMMILKLSTDLLVLDAVRGILYPIGIMFWLNRILIDDVPKVLCHDMLIFNNHVMQDKETCHYLPWHL